MYTGNPSTNPIDALRVEWGDTDDFFLILQNSEYQYVLDKYTSTTQQSKQIGLMMLAKLALTSVRERVGQEERFGQDAFNNFYKLLKDKVTNPAFGNLTPLIYAGGTNRCETAAIATDQTLIDSPFFRGQSSGVADWQKSRNYFPVGHIVEPSEKVTDYPEPDGFSGYDES